MQFKGKGEAKHTDVAKDLRILIIHARWNARIVDTLVAGAKNRLLELGVQESNIVVDAVSGSYELPFGIWTHHNIENGRKSNKVKGYHATIAIGTLIKGDTMHFEYIADSVSKELMSMQFKIERPIIFGLLTVLTEDQALERAGLLNGHRNLGIDWAEAAVEMAAKGNLEL